MTDQPRPTIRQQAGIIEKLVNYDESERYARAFEMATTYDELVEAFVAASGLPIPLAKASLVWCSGHLHLSQAAFDEALTIYLAELRVTE